MNLQKNQTFSKKSQLEFLQASKQTAIQIKKTFPQSEIYPFGPDNNQCHWSWQKMGGCKDIEGYNKPCYWGLKLSSVPLCVLDFDLKPKPTGMTEKRFEELKAEFKIKHYPFFSLSRSGRGGHYWFKDENAPKKETNMDKIQGIDYKVSSIIFLNAFPFDVGLVGIRDLPPEYLAHQKYSKPKAKKGRFHKQQADSYKAMINGSPSGVLEAYRIARNKGQTITEAMSVAGPSLGKMEVIPDPPAPAIRKNLNTQKKGCSAKEQTKVLTLQQDESPALIKKRLYALREELLKEADNKVITPQFYDKKTMVFPKAGFLLFSGGTECGKTATALEFIRGLLKKKGGHHTKTPISIWEHSESNKANRFNTWMKDTNIDKKSIFYSWKRHDIIDRLHLGGVVLIDDTDSFFRIAKPTDRREIADIIEPVSIICQLLDVLVIGCHYQTKTSKGERDIKNRSGGGLHIINKVRHACIIEKGDKEVTIDLVGNELGETRADPKVEKKSFLTIQKGHRPEAKEFSWWLNDDYSLGESISAEDVDALIAKNLTPEKSDSLLKEIAMMIEDYLKDIDSYRMPRKTFNTMAHMNFGLSKSASSRYLNLLKGTYNTGSSGFGAKKVHWIEKV